MIEGMTKDEHYTADMWDYFSVGLCIGVGLGLAICLLAH